LGCNRQQQPRRSCKFTVVTVTSLVAQLVSM
jgi:hypothetical protein